MKCRNVNGLIKAVKKNQDAKLTVWDIMNNNYASEGAYLNLGEGKYSYVGKETWHLIRSHIVNEKGEYYSNLKKYNLFYA